VEFDIDGSSIGLQSAGKNFLISFSCKTEDACIKSPDGHLQYRGFGIACPDATECNRLVIEFSSLLDQVSPQGIESSTSKKYLTKRLSIHEILRESGWYNARLCSKLLSSRAPLRGSDARSFPYLQNTAP
jgi:hypothetical protein